MEDMTRGLLPECSTGILIQPGTTKSIGLNTFSDECLLESFEKELPESFHKLKIEANTKQHTLLRVSSSCIDNKCEPNSKDIYKLCIPDESNLTPSPHSMALISKEAFRLIDELDYSFAFESEEALIDEVIPFENVEFLVENSPEQSEDEIMPHTNKYSESRTSPKITTSNTVKELSGVKGQSMLDKDDLYNCNTPEKCSSNKITKLLSKQSVKEEKENVSWRNENQLKKLPINTSNVKKDFSLTANYQKLFKTQSESGIECPVRKKYECKSFFKEMKGDAPSNQNIPKSTLIGGKVKRSNSVLVKGSVMSVKPTLNPNKSCKTALKMDVSTSSSIRRTKSFQVPGSAKSQLKEPMSNLEKHLVMPKISSASKYTTPSKHKQTLLRTPCTGSSFATPLQYGLLKRPVSSVQADSSKSSGTYRFSSKLPLPFNVSTSAAANTPRKLLFDDS